VCVITKGKKEREEATTKDERLENTNVKKKKKERAFVPSREGLGTKLWVWYLTKHYGRRERKFGDVLRKGGV